MTKNKIQSAVYYPVPVYKQKLYLKLGHKECLPITEKFSKEVLSLPVHPSLTKKELDKIVSVINHLWS